MNDSALRVTYLTAGAAGMFCGSCMHDNTLARWLGRAGVDIQLVPCYTPIRTDEEDVSVDRVFFGGINVFLQQKLPLFRHLPGFLDHWLDQPWLIRLATQRAIEVDPKELGGLTVSMLRGTHGYQKKEVRRLVHWLERSARPQLVVLTNMLIAGCVPEIRRRLKIPVLVTLQGDDIFLDELPEPYKGQAFTEIRRLVEEVDGFIVHSRYYADFMADYFSIPHDKLHHVRLGLDTDDFAAPNSGESRPAIDAGAAPSRPVRTIGYLARLAPEKGLHLLVDAFVELRRRPGHEDMRLQIAGWLGAHRREFAETQFQKLRDAGLADHFEYIGSVDRHGKLDFLRGLDVLSVPTTYHEPKGLFVLEALAAGVPVVQPSHGAFPELLEATGGGILVRPDDPHSLADGLERLLADEANRRSLAEAGREMVHSRHNGRSMAEETVALFRSTISGRRSMTPVA